MRGQRSTPNPSRRWRLSLAVGCVSALSLALLPGATADDDTPSREEVRKAQERVATTADQVDAIEAQLMAADRRLRALSIAAGKAAEAYNGARYQLREARTDARRAERRADAAAAEVRRQADRVGEVLASNFENGGALASLGILVREPDPDALLEQLDAYEGVTGALQARLHDYEAAQVVAGVLQDRAETAEQQQEDATEEAEAAKEAAEAAVAEAQSAAATIAAKKTDLVRELARVRGVSVELARERQHELAERAAEKAAEEAAEQAEQQEQQEPTEESENESDPPPDEESDPPPDDDTDPPPADNDPAPSDGVDAAIAFAKAQLGEPYVYGADGPDSWDCSGLTMRAWAAAGESLSHWSVAQYYETTPISFSDIRRGDLLFWSDSSDPDTIYHVAMYLGNGMMIQAPSPGGSVEIVSLYYWILPNLYARV